MQSPPIKTKEKRRFDLEIILSSPAFYPGVALCIGFFALYWPYLIGLPKLWLSEEGYYSHGFLIPFLSGYIISSNWEKLSTIEVKPVWYPLLLLIPTFILIRASYVTYIEQLTSFGLIASLLIGVWFIGGLRWMLALTLPILFLSFALPVWTAFIDEYTNPLQMVSTKVAFEILETIGLTPLMGNTTTIYLNNFTLDVGVPCSGLKLVLAVSAFTIFFILISRLKWWSNAIMLATVIPLCLFINGLRVALIGVVGDRYGRNAGIQFHDYSGYIVLIICFFVLFRLARWLGWKD